MKRNLIVLLSLVFVSMAVCADDAERHGSKMMNAKAVSSERVATGGVRSSVTVEESRYLASIGLWPGIAQGMRKSYVLKLDRDADFPRGTLLASEGRMGNGFLIRDCRFGSTRGRGLLLKASDGCVENCRVMKPSETSYLPKPT